MAPEKEPLSKNRWGHYGTMSRNRPPLALPAVGLDRADREPLHRQVYEALRQAILSGRLRAGARLPASRALARELGSARNTVLTAYQQLMAEGYVTARVGAGTTVANTLPDELLRSSARPTPAPRTRAAPPPLSRRGRLIAAMPAPGLAASAPRPFRPGLPALEAFPVDIWTRLLTRRSRLASRALLQYGDVGGYRPLREAIAVYLGEARAVRCDPDQVFIVTGSQQAVDLAARLLLDPGDRVWVEDPGYPAARGALVAAGAKLVPVPVDHEGLVVAEGARSGRDARIVYVTPSHQFPLGATMSLTRRLALLEWARRAGAWIVEDDYDSEYRYEGRPLAALHALDASRRVIYSGTFSKVLFPGLRLGYVVVPPTLVDAFIAALTLTGRHSPSVMQAALTDFIVEGHFARHLRRTRTLYAERQAVLVESVRAHGSAALEVRRQAAGMHLVAWLTRGTNDRAASETASRTGIDAPPLSECRIRPARPGGLLLGYTAWTPQEIRDGIVRLLRALESRRADPRR